MSNKVREISIKIVHTTDESKDTPKKYGEMWIKIRDLVILITSNSDDYDEKYMKIKFILDNVLLLNKMKIDEKSYKIIIFTTLGT